MSDGCATGSSGETSVGDQCHAGAQPHACNGRGGIQHLSHAGTTLRSFIADHYYIACHDFTGLDSINRIFFTVKYSGRAFVHQHLGCHSRSLDHATVRCQVTLQYSNTAGLGIGVLHRADDFRILVDTILDILSYGRTVGSQAVKVQKSLLGQFIHYRIDTACFVQVFHISRTGRCQVTQIRSLGRDLVGDLQVQFHTCFSCDSGQMQHGIGRASQCHIHSQGISEGFRSHDVSGTDIFLYQFHDLHAGMLCQTDTLGIYGGNRTVAAKSHTNGFGQTVHGVRSIHTGTGAAGRTYLFLELSQFIHSHGTGCHTSHCLEHRG